MPAHGDDGLGTSAEDTGDLIRDPGNFSLFHDAATAIGTIGFIAVWAAFSFWLLAAPNDNE